METVTLKMDTKNGKQAAALLDVQGYWHREENDYAKMEARIDALYRMGIRHVIIVVSNPGYSMYTATCTGPAEELRYFTKNLEKYRAPGFASPEYAFVKLCHERGMSCYASFKPYKGGGMESIPLSARYDRAVKAHTERLGIAPHLDTFLYEQLKEGREYRVIRRNDGGNDDLGGLIDRITVDFVTDSYRNGESGLRRDTRGNCRSDRRRKRIYRQGTSPTLRHPSVGEQQ